MVQFHWHTEPLLILTLLGLGWSYALLTGPLRLTLFGPSVSFPLWSSICAMIALISSYLAVGSPLDQIGESYLFSMHMLQHMLIMYWIPVFCLLAIPSWMVDSLLKFRAPCSIARVLIHPIFSGLLLTSVFTIWHVPALYEVALHNKIIHILEHVTLFIPSLLVWWAFLSPSRILPPITYPLRMIFVFLLMVGQLPVFAFLTFSGEVLYPTYLYAVRLEFLALTPMEDQALGGVIMKIVNMGISIIIFCASFYLWAMQNTPKDISKADISLKQF